MKNFYFILTCLIFLSVQLKAQAPNYINYQGVARNVSGLVLPNQNIGLRFSIHQGSTNGTIVYQETQSATTNQLGLFTVSVGSGTVVTGTFSSIAWGVNAEYMQVEMDPTGGNSYLNMGTNQFLSVPYALNAGSSSSAWNLTGNSSTNGTDYIGTTDANDLIFKTGGNENARISNSTGFVGIGSNNPKTNLVVNGAEAIGSSYDTIAPPNGLIVSGQVGIGTKTPNTGAALDITSSTQGILIPRLTTNPVSPSLGMMYFNTSTHCLMFYDGTAWESVVCGCPNVATAGSITGLSTFCPSGTGVSYSISPLSNATGYQWTVPSDAAITSGQGSNAILVTEGTTSGNITVAASNNCGAGPSNTLAITPITTNITGQPANASVTCASGNATFTVTASGGGLTYQWQVNTGSGFTSIANAGVYSGATLATLTISSPPTGMNGYQYRCIVTGTCSFTSNAATLTVSSLQSVPITLTNSQSSVTSAGLQVMLTINFSTYSSDGENANLNNVEFTTGPAGTGTPLYAWLENGSSSTPATVPSSSSTAAIVWVNLGSKTITNGSPITIYMNFMPSPVMTSTTSYTGEAPQLTGTTSPTYGEYDNGLLVFPGFYDNFSGTSLATKWTWISSGIVGVTVNNKLTLSAVVNQNWYGIYTNTFSSALNNISETYAVLPANNGLCINTSGSNGNKINNGNTGVDAQFQLSPNDYVAYGGSCTTAPTANTTSGGISPVSNTYYVFSFLMLNTPVAQINYGNYTSLTGTGATLNTISATSEVGLGISAPTTGPTFTFQWFRIRTNPPNSVQPTAVFGAYGCY